MGARMLPQFSCACGPGAASRRACRAALTVRVLLLLIGALCAPLLPAQNPLGSLLGKTSPAPTPAPAPAPPAEAQAPTAIPLPEVSTRAEELAHLLRALNGQLPTRDQLDALKEVLTERDKSLQSKHKEVETLLAGSPGALELREQATYWHSFSTEGAATRRQLLDWANAAQAAVQQLQTLGPQWTLTLEETSPQRIWAPRSR
jgi:hypothetical protein